MNQNEIQEIKKILSLLALYFRDDLPDVVLLMYAKDLSDLDFQATVNALEQLRKEKGRRVVPLPADVYAIVQPKVSSKSVADDIANRIIAAFRRHGLAWTSGYVMNGITRYDSSTEEGLKSFDTFPEAVISEVGDIGWATLIRMGGYSSACREWSDANGGTFRAQLRDLVTSILEQAKAGKLKEVAALPAAATAQPLGARNQPALMPSQEGMHSASAILEHMKEVKDGK